MSKYRSRRTRVDGIAFDSQKEANRYAELKLMQQAGAIRELELQPRFRCEVNGVHVCDYVGDFRYMDLKLSMSITEDVKSPATKTPIYRLKKKLVWALHAVDITEV